jgi:hypothetical protein
VTQQDTDPFDTFPDYDLSDPDERVAACRMSLGELPTDEIRTIASQLGVYPQHATLSELLDALAEETVFKGPIGDPTVYIRIDGESIPLDEHLEDTE